jgi:hypothetical protein
LTLQLTRYAQTMQIRLKTSNQKLRMTDGRELRILGTINLPLFIDNQVIHQLMLVADVEIPAMLGYIMVYGKHQR